MSKVSNPLMTLCEAARFVVEQDASSSQKLSLTQGKLDARDVYQKWKAYQSKVKIAPNIYFKPYTRKIPNNLIAVYIENTSDELRKRFSYKCKFSPSICSEIVESYGSEAKAFSEIKQHIWNDHILGDSIPDLTKRKPVTSSIHKMSRPFEETSKSSKRSCSVKTVKTISEGGSNRGKPILQKPSEKQESVHASLDTHFEADEGKDFNVTTVTLKSGQFEHDYAKSEDEPSTANPAVHEAGQNKNQLVKSDAHNKWISYFIRHLNGDSYLKPSIIRTPPFPFVYTPEPLEAAQVVELNLNGDPVDLFEPVFVQSSASRISSKKTVENKVSRKKSKSARMDNTPRSVLECVENRVTCKPSVSSQQRDALVPDNSIENSENVEKSINEIAWRNIRILNQQRRKRKYRDRPSVYVCEICNKHFTANTSLSYHYKGHLNLKPFKCEICCRTFTRRHSLNYHMMIHENKNRFRCPTCARPFRHPSHYKEHLRKHTGEEPYSCKFCSNKFKTRNSYKRHLKMQHEKLLTSNGIVSIHNS